MPKVCFSSAMCVPFPFVRILLTTPHEAPDNNFLMSAFHHVIAAAIDKRALLNLFTTRQLLQIASLHFAILRITSYQFT